MCSSKTGVLARLSARLTAVICGASPEFIESVGEFAASIGVAFQIQDDILNISGVEFATKNICIGEDIHEGKRSLMVIHSLEHAPEEKSKRLLEILNAQPSDQPTINEAIAIITQSGSIEYAMSVAKDIISKAWSKLEPLLPQRPEKEKLRIFTNYLVERKI